MKKSYLLPSLFVLACGGDDGHNHSHSGSAGGEHCVADKTAVTMTTTPNATQSTDTAFDVTWMVENNTGDDLHVSEVRYCVGTDIADCGLGEQATYTTMTGQESNTECMYKASITIDTAGSYTLVSYAHIGLGAQGAHRSAPINIDVAAP